MLGQRTCGGLLNKGSFENVASESQSQKETADAYGSSCTYLPPEEEGEPPHRGIGGGAVSLAVYNRITYEFRGKERNLASFIPWPPMTTKRAVGIGSHAYYGFGFGDEEAATAFGVVQVRNDVVTIAAEFKPQSVDDQDAAFIEERLKAVADELCAQCK